MTGILLVDHGSRREESNALLLQIVAALREHTAWPIVEPAHMELAEPTIATAIQRCVDAGASRIVVFPYFLGPGRHWREDIPRLAAEAARSHPGVQTLVTAPFGLHPLMFGVIRTRLEDCLATAAGQADGCELCAGGEQCHWSSQLPES